ncbi:MAG TPA: hypothetical protein VE177_03490, partial [Candidatus Binatus sp.]|nr:hypothetical protein [Candidatus Binatus sp.]
MTLSERSSKYTYSDVSKRASIVMPGARDDALEEEDEELAGAEEDEGASAGPAPPEKNALLDVTVVPFELLSGVGSADKLARLK